MIDTVKIKRAYRTCISHSDLIGHHGAVYLPNRRVPTYALNGPLKSAHPRITVIQTPNGLTHVSAEFSVPRVLFGHNAILPSEADCVRTLEMVREFVEKRLPLSFDLSKLALTKVDFTKDIDLGEPGAYAMLMRLFQIDVPRFKSDLFGKSTLYLTRGNKRFIRIYPKLKEVLDKKESEAARMAARGKLRIESCYHSKRMVVSFGKSVGLETAAPLGILRKEIADQAFSSPVFPFCLEDSLPPDAEQEPIFEKLLEKHSPRTAIDLYGFIALTKSLGPRFYLDERYGISKDAYYRRRKACRNAGIMI